jgi:hypothetical protein
LEFPDCCEGEKDADPDDDSWSIDVNFDGSEAQDSVCMRSGSLFNFPSFAAWLDTGQKVLDVLRRLWGLCWDIMRFVFWSGNKESFSW